MNPFDRDVFTYSSLKPETDPNSYSETAHLKVRHVLFTAFSPFLQKVPWFQEKMTRWVLSPKHSAWPRNTETSSIPADET